MKKTSILLFLCFLIIALTACDSKANQSSGLAQDNSIPEQVESNTQEPDAVEVDTQESDAQLSMPNTVEGQIERIMNGDISNVTGFPDWNVEFFVERCNSEDYEWVECELNGNGLKGLLWRERDSSPLEIQRVDAIFAVTDNEARLVDSTFGRQMTEIFFLSKNGNIIYRYGIYGPESYDYYAYYIYTDDGSKELANDLTIVAYDWEVVKRNPGKYGLSDAEVEKYPSWAIAGICYYTKDREEALDEPQFLKAFVEMTGYSLYNDNPLKPDWID